MIISNYFPGRIRLRDAVLKDTEIRNALRSAIENHESITEIQVNETTGSVLILYNPEKLPLKKLTALKDELLELNTLVAHYSESIKSDILVRIAELAEKLA